MYDGALSRAFGGASLAYDWTLPDGSHASTPSVTYEAAGSGARP